MLALALAAGMLATACGPMDLGFPPVDARTLTVFAAASLTDSFREIGSAFEAVHPGVAVTFNFAGSQALRTQMEEGALADVFASASAKEMDALTRGDLVAEGASQLFVSNHLVVILPPDNPAGIVALGDLAAPGVKLVLAAEAVPVGQYARQSLHLMNAKYGAEFDASVLANVVSNEDNVKQVVAKVQLGEADAGITYSSDAVAAPYLVRIEIPAEFNVIANYPIAQLKAASDASLADEFITFVLSKQGQAILEKWGFLPPP